jgi:hypothetical protein
VLRTDVGNLKKKIQKNKRRKMKHYLDKTIERLKRVTLVDGLVYGFVLWGLLSAWISFAWMTTDPLGTNLAVLSFFGSMFAAKTYSAYLAHGRSEKAWMVAVSWVPLVEMYYLYTRKWKRGSTPVDAEMAA